MVMMLKSRTKAKLNEVNGNYCSNKQTGATQRNENDNAMKEHKLVWLCGIKQMQRNLQWLQSALCQIAELLTTYDVNMATKKCIDNREKLDCSRRCLNSVGVSIS